MVPAALSTHPKRKIADVSQPTHRGAGSQPAWDFQLGRRILITSMSGDG